MKQNKTIRVDGVKSTDKQITILMNTGKVYKNGEPQQDKYKIWINGQDGKPSVPYLQFQEIRPIAGDTLDVETYEVEKEFTNPAGEQIKYMDRTINHFVMADGKPATIAPDAPQSPQTSETPQSEHQVALKAYLQQLETRIRVLEDWKDKQPVFADIDGKQVQVPDCFNKDDEIRPEGII
jgi:hypothetical protein